MGTPKIKREIVAVFMESPLYFSIPLKKRLEFIMFFSQQPIYDQICELNKHLLNEIVTLNSVVQPDRWETDHRANNLP